MNELSMPTADLDVAPLESRDELLAQYNQMDLAQLLELLREMTFASIRLVNRMAVAVHVLETKWKVDLRKFKFTFVPYLREVWRGTMRPEVIAHFIITENRDRPLIPIVGSLPIAEQLRLSDGGTVPLAVPEDNKGNYTKREVDPLDLTPSQVDRVFRDGKILTDKQQTLILEEKRTAEVLATPVEAKPEPPPRVVVGRLSIDPAGRGVFFKGELIRWEEMDEAFKHRKKRRPRKTG